VKVERLDDDKLQQYFDGELAEAEAAEVQAALESSEDNRARLTALERLHELMAVHAKSQHPGIAADDIFARITSGIATEIAEGRHETLRPVVTHPPLPVPELAERDKPVEGWKVWIPAIVGAAAAAAVVAFALGGGDSTSTDRSAGTTTVEEPTVIIEEMDVEEGVTIVEAPHGTSVEEVDFGDNVGTVFEVEGEAGEPIAVVWIMEDEMEQATQ
jgi:hypothetical protein